MNSFVKRIKSVTTQIIIDNYIYKMFNKNSKGYNNRHSFFVFIDQVYLKVDDIHLIFQLPKDFVVSLMHRIFNKEDYLYLKDSYWITYDTLSKADFNPYHITSALELTATFFTNFKKSRSRNNDLIFIYEKLAIDVKKPPNISVIFTDLEHRTTINVRALTYTYNAFFFLAGLRTTTTRECFLLYINLLRFRDDTIDYSYKSKSLDAFKTKLHKFRTVGIKAIFHKYWHNRNAAIKFSPDEITILKDNFRDGNYISFRQTCRDINMIRILKGQKRVSVQTVISQTKNLEEYAKLFIARKGSEGIEKVIMHFDRVDADYPGDQYQADGSKYPFPYKTEDGKLGYLTLIAAIDVFSRRIVGYKLAISETFTSYFQVLKQSILECNKLPAEFVIDNHKTLHSATAKRYFGKLTSMGVIVRYCRVKNPEDKAHIENFFNILNMMYSKRLDGYQGENMPSRREGAHPNNDLRKFFTRPSNLRTRSEVEELVKTEIDSYNGTYNIKNSVPRLLFSNAPMEHAIELDANLKRVLLFEERVGYLRKLGVEFSFDNRDYQYPIDVDQIEIFYKYLNKELIVRFDPNDLNRIYLYELSTYNLICDLKKHEKVPVALVTHTAKDTANLLKVGWKRAALIRKLREDILTSESSEMPVAVINNGVGRQENVAKQTIANKKAIKIKDGKENVFANPTENLNPTDVDPKVIELKLALSQLFKVNGSNKAIN